MLTDKVKKLSPEERLSYWVSERESIRRKREAGKQPPWTDDVILQTYRFCNVRRMDDKVSQWLLKNWYEPHRDHPNMIAACALARFINLPSSLESIAWPVFNPIPGPDPAWSDIKKSLRKKRDAGYTVFNGAYMVRGNDGMDKIECVVDYYVRPMWESHCEKPLVLSSTMLGTWTLLSQQYGFGSFMAGQVVADLRHAVTGHWSDCRTWAPAGPGSIRGLNRLHGRNLKTMIPQDQFTDELTEVMKTLTKSLPKSITSRLEAIDYQNCLCEFDKYERTLFEGRRPKAKFTSGGRAVRDYHGPKREEPRKQFPWKKSYTWLLIAAEQFFCQGPGRNPGEWEVNWTLEANELAVFLESRFPGLTAHMDEATRDWSTPWATLLRTRVYYMFKNGEKIKGLPGRPTLTRATLTKEHWRNWKNQENVEKCVSRVTEIVSRKLTCKTWKNWL